MFFKIVEFPADHFSFSYLVLLGGFYMAPANMDTSDDPLLLSTSGLLSTSIGMLDRVTWFFGTCWNTLFSR